MNPITAIVQRNLLNYVRSKGRVFGSLFMSMFMLVMFSFLMKSSMSSVNAPMNYLISGVIIMSVFQTSVNNSSDILADISSGYMKEVMVAPILRSQISIGNILSGAVVAALQGAVTAIIGIVIGLRIDVLQGILMLAVMFVSAMTFSAVGLFLATVSRNSPAFQTISCMIMMPLTFVSGAYIPTTIIPAFLLPIVYINPLTYTTSIFRYIALGANKMTAAELVNEGIAFQIGSFTITPVMGLLITVLIGAFFFAVCVMKFNKADFSTVKVAKNIRGGGEPQR
ncbi:ABC transporter permease [Fumia xinanensis]|uniref:Transport permease protein n=1 Tax=Fumia xinanensis TaxID=2763659 RepID=A0A926E5F2_9FIRM|nr:ABC transporter permease [Fumia xinanensis]MBC8559840.1 ABC transporter permease [Fumia xinanensis]